MGYRGFQTNQAKPLFPFGFGLSYAKFTYADFAFEDKTDTGPQLVASFQVTNTGSRA